MANIPPGSGAAGRADEPDAASGSLHHRVPRFTEASLRSPLMRAETVVLAQGARELGLAVCYTPNYRASAWSGGAVEAAGVQRQALALADVVLMNAEETRSFPDAPIPAPPRAGSSPWGHL